MRSKSVTFILASGLLLMPIVPAAAGVVTSAADTGATTSAATTTEPTTTEPTTTEPTTAPTPTTTPTTPAPDEDDGEVEVEVDNAELRWGLSNEANNRAFAPDTFNFFSAGRVKDPGSGGNTLRSAGTGATWSNGKAAGWAAQAGDVSIEKWNGTTYRPATFAGTSTDADGTALGSPSSGTFSGHQMVFGHGEGRVDAARGAATIRWNGDVTVLFYSGMSFFYISDPVLTVKAGVGTVTATLGGFSSSQSDPTAWSLMTPKRVTVADLGPVDLTNRGGFTITPRYLGVTVTGVGQAPGVPNFGSFPQSYVDFHAAAGTAAFWLSSGGSADPYKPALPMTISYDAAEAVAPPAPPTTDGPTPDPVDNDVLPPPDVTPPDVAPPDLPPPANLTPAASAPPAAQAGSSFSQVAQPITTTAVAFAEPAETDGRERWWWVGGSLLLAAALTLAGPVLVMRPRPTR